MAFSRKNCSFHLLIEVTSRSHLILWSGQARVVAALNWTGDQISSGSMNEASPNCDFAHACFRQKVHQDSS